jgi:dTDP-4-dehydrorhamnose reductase
MTSYLVVGAGGMLGSDLCSALAERDVTALTRAQLDITDPVQVAQAVAGRDVVINAAAYTHVDDAELNEAAATAVNGLGAGILAAAAASAGARFVQVSTDYVFSGDATSPYPEDAPLDPANAYGRSKAAGEVAVAAAHPAPLIVRTAWLYGESGSSFPRTMLDLAARHDTVSVVDDQHGQPTWTRDLADGIVRLLDAAKVGAFHGTSSGETTWYGFAREVFRLAGLDPDRVVATTSAAFPRPARRPAYSVLGHDAWVAAGVTPLRDWRAALAAASRAGLLETA